jgi:hypothetical protein
MTKITREMLKIYIPYSNLDWMNYKLAKKDLTFHHIIKRAEGGKKEISNGALLMPTGHQYLHVIEFKDYKTYKYINEIFKLVNKQQYEPTKDQRETIEYLLMQFEKKHIKDKTSKGKQLIKYQYTQRHL